MALLKEGDNRLLWFNEQELAIKWFEDGVWKKYLLARKGRELFCSTTDRSRINVVIQEEEVQNDDQHLLYRIKVEVTPNAEGRISGVQLLIPLVSTLTCTWKPHLTPKEDMVIGDKVFRSPSIIVENKEVICALIPDLNDIQNNRPLPHIMDYVRDGHYLLYGLCDYKATGHVYYQMKPMERSYNQTIRFQFYMAQWGKEKQAKRDFRPIERFLWDRFAKPYLAAEKNQTLDLKQLERYVSYTYDWAFKRWKSVCWQEFDIDGQRVGGHVFIVTAKQKPGQGKEEEWREAKSIWNQAWFCSLRSSYGYALWGRHWGDRDLIEKAEKNLQFALSAPQINGLFPSCYVAGKKNSWEKGGWQMSSNRCPDPGHVEYVHLLDASWTCYWLLKWFRDIKRDEKILAYVRRYVNRLLSLQFEGGNFPSWVRPHDLDCSPYLKESPETSMHIMLLCLLHEIEPNSKYIQAAERAATFITDYIMPLGRWEDFETYWSCSNEWEGKKYGKVDRRSGLYNQCNLGIYWTAEALKELYWITRKPVYLEHGEKALAEMSLYQQIWQPPFFQIPTMGGFGVMTSDDEWNDARQSLFALTYLDYYKLTGIQRYRDRGILAMKASFYMMYCPENDEVKELYDANHPNFDQYDYGFHMENFNHGDSALQNRVGEFTIFDWGNGAAATSLAECILEHHKNAL